MNKFTILFLLIIFNMPFLFCQENVVDTVYLGNASFEGIPGGNRVPQNWADCGPEDMSPPDIHPTGIWQVWTPSYDGYTYIGMVARENNTWESVSQRLPSILLKDSCYSFSIYMCRSTEYTSGIAPRYDVTTEPPPDQEYLATLEQKMFDSPLKLTIWGGKFLCGRSEILAESEPIDHEEWRMYSWVVQPEDHVLAITLEASFIDPDSPVNGNILLDKAGPFVKVKCD